MKNCLPNKELLKSLYTEYYVEKSGSGDKFLSSYWKEHSSLASVKMDADGNVVLLSGAGFGALETKNPLNRILAYMGHLSYLIALPERAEIIRLMSPSREVIKRMGIFFSFDCFKQVCSLALIKKHMPLSMKKKRPVFMVVGDGCGFLSSLIKSVFPDSTIVLADIGTTLFFQAYYCQKVHPKYSHRGISETPFSAKEDFIYCPCERLEEVDMFEYDVAVNIVSMQEMNLPTIERYFSYLRKYCSKENLFYCCNRERKELPGGEVTEFLKYPWKADDRHLADGYCPWIKYYLSFNTEKKGPAPLGVRIPFINYFEGPIMHRLTTLMVSDGKTPKR